MSSLPAFILPIDTPDWFLNAISQPRTSHFATTDDGTRIHYVCWNEQDRDKPALMFLHGYRAHAHVWDFIAPFFTDHFRVVAMDLSGMGDSGWHKEYGDSTFNDDIRAVIDHAELKPITIVGHSYGGVRSIDFAAAWPHYVEYAIIIDSLITFEEIDAPRDTVLHNRFRPYPDYASIIARYRLMPDQPAPAWAHAYIAHHSVREVDDGWAWKFDPNIMSGRTEYETSKRLRQLQMPADYICGGSSILIDTDRAQRIVEAIGQGRKAIVIPEAHHHIMLDQPMACIGALRALLA